MEDDKKLYKSFLNGDQKSFELIMDKYMENLIYFIYGFVKRIDVAEDLAQDVFVYILMNKKKYDFKYSLKTYLYIIAKSKAINYIKREKRITYLQDNEYIFTEQEIEDIIFNKEDSKTVKSAIDDLPEPQSQIIYLSDTIPRNSLLFLSPNLRKSAMYYKKFPLFLRLSPGFPFKPYRPVLFFIKQALTFLGHFRSSFR